MITEHIMDNPEDLGPAEAVLDADPFAGDRLIACLLSGSEFTAAVVSSWVGRS